MQIPGDSGPLLKTLVEAGLDACSQAAKPKSIKQPEDSRGHHDATQPKPGCLIERWENVKRGSRSCIIPHAIVVGGDHMKSIVSRRQIGKKRLSAPQWVLPIGIMAFELIAEAHFFRNHEAERRIVDLDVARARGKLKAIARKILLSVCDDLLHVNRRGNAVPLQMFRINHLQNIFVRKP